MNLLKCIYSDSLECMIAISKNKRCIHYKPHELTDDCKVLTCSRDDYEESFVNTCKCIPIEEFNSRRKK
jgi:hypothetical protein